MTKTAAMCFFFLLAAASAPLALASDPIQIGASVNQNEMLIGDQIDYHISVEWDPATIGFQRIEPSPELGVFEIIDFEKAGEIDLPDGRKRRDWNLTLSTFETGGYEIPPFEVKYTNAEGEEAVGFTQPIQITVNSALDTAENLRDVRPLKPPAAISVDPKYFRRNVALASGAAFIIAFLIWFFAFRSRRAGLDEEEWGPPRPIDEVAYEALDALEAEGLAARGEIKAYYSRLSEILRIFLGSRYLIFAIDMTSLELRRALDGRFGDSQAWSLFGRFCEEADMAKFAKWTAPIERCVAAMQAVRQIVEATAPDAESVEIVSGEGAEPAPELESDDQETQPGAPDAAVGASSEEARS